MKSFLKALVWCGLGALIGCSDQIEPQVGGQAPDSWLSVSTDPTVVAETRRRADEADDREYEAWFAGVSDSSGYLDPDSLELLLRRKDETFDRLMKLLERGPMDPAAVSAAVILCKLQQSAGREVVRRVLQDGPAQLRVDVLRRIDHAIGYLEQDEQAHREFVLADADLVTAMLGQLHDGNPQVVTAAIQTCGILELPGVNQELRELLAQSNPPDRGRILFWLSKGPLTGDLLDAALATRDEWSPDNVGWDAELLEAFARHENDEWRTRARDELKRRLAAWPDDGRRGFRGDRLDIVDALGRTSDNRDVPWLAKVVDQERGYYASPLAAALVRLEGEAGKTRLLAMLHHSERWSVGLDVATGVYKGTGDEDIVAAVAAVGEEKKGRELARVCRALVELGGDLAASQVKQFMSKLDEVARAEFRLLLDRPPLTEMAQRLAASGILEKHLLDQAVAKIENTSRRDADYTPSLLYLLGESGIVAAFDAETDMLPCRHDQLVLDLAQASRGVFAPQAVCEQWLQQHDEDLDAEYVLSFVFHERGYTARLRNFGDWYDIERVTLMINRSLADSALAERFIALEGGGQVASFVFADPDKLAPLAAEFGLPLSENLNSAREQGQEFERQVLEQYNE